MVSEGNETRSTASTRSPCRASSIAVAAPATRAPTTITSYQPAPIVPPCCPVPYAAVWTLHTVAYSHGGAEGKRPAAAHPRRLDHRRLGRDRGRRPGRGGRGTARRPPRRHQGQLLLALREPGRAARGRDQALGAGDDDRRGRGDHRRCRRAGRPVPAPCGRRDRARRAGPGRPGAAGQRHHPAVAPALERVTATRLNLIAAL